MGKNHHNSLGTKVRMLCFALALCGMYVIYQDDRATNAILSFLFGGVVPGTDITLSPDTVMYTVAGIIAAGLLFIILKVVFIVFWQHGGSAAVAASPTVMEESKTVEAEVLTAQDEPAPIEEFATPAVRTPNLKLSAPSLSSLWRKMPHGMTQKARPIVARQYADTRRGLASFVTRGGALAAQTVRLVFEFIRWQVIQRFINVVAILVVFTWRLIKFIVLGMIYLVGSSIRFTRLFVTGFSRIVSQLSRKVYKGTIIYTEMFWKWLSPYLWELDGWLEKETHRLIAWLRSWIGNKVDRHDDLKFALNITHESAKLLSKARLAPGVKSQSEKTKVQP